MTNLEQKLSALPDTSGVYIMRDASGEVIYVGKAISLKRRVRQYFQSARNHAPKVRAMVAHVADFDILLTQNELEALVLECNLIKQYKPHYNILLKDDKHYPYVRVNLKEAFPRVEVVRRVAHDGAQYFGPFRAAHSVREVVETLRRIFPLRTCKRDLPAAIGRERPCLNYQIGRCMAPCQGGVSQSEYHAMMQRVCAFLSGKHEELLRDLQQQMQAASAALAFEKAARFRDQMQAVERIIQHQQAIDVEGSQRDIIGLAPGGGRCVVQVLFMRRGKIVQAETSTMEQAEDEQAADILASFLLQYYGGHDVRAREILLPMDVPDMDILAELLSERAGRKVHILVPRRGEKRKLVEMAERNALQTRMRQEKKREQASARTQGAIAELAAVVGLAEPPQRMECYDISNTQGVYSVASMVVFEGGKPAKKEYRRFRIKTVEGANDFASLAETLTRRYKRLLAGDEGFGARPDLIVIDGGREQLRAVKEALDALGCDIPLCSLAKRYEEIYLPDREQPVRLPHTTMALQLMQRIRDEAHRFAITYHRSLRSKGSLASVLEEIPGIGPKRRSALLRTLGSASQIAQASLEEIEAVPGMTRAAAEAVYSAMHQEKA
nr:excinuclease ABC subunit UvrC [Maliibacterium massiliense]